MIQFARSRHPCRCFVRCVSLTALQSAVEKLRVCSEARLTTSFVVRVFLSGFPLVFHVGYMGFLVWIVLFLSLISCAVVIVFRHCAELSELFAGHGFDERTFRTIRTTIGPLLPPGSASRPQGRWLVAGGRLGLLFVNKLVACGGRWVSSGCPQGVPSLPIWVTALMGARRRDVLVFLSPGVFLVVHLS